MPEPQLNKDGDPADPQTEQCRRLETEVAELKAALASERQRADSLLRTVTSLRSSTASLLNTCEQAQEGISNRLIREISRLRTLQLDMCADVEAEEARLIEVLEERLKTLRAEKCDLENALEQEQERIVNKLQRQMEELRLLYEPDGSNHHKLGMPSPSKVLPLSPSHSLSPSQTLSPHSSHPAQTGPEIFREREAELHRQVSRLQEENQQLLCENIRLQNKLRRQSIEDSPLIEPLASSSPPPPLRRSDSQSSMAASKGRSPSQLLSLPTGRLTPGGNASRRSFQADRSPREFRLSSQSDAE